MRNKLKIDAGHEADRRRRHCGDGSVAAPFPGGQIGRTLIGHFSMTGEASCPSFPVDVFTPAWQAWLSRASHGAGVRSEHVAVPLLGVVSSLIGTARRVRASRSWSQPMTVWTCLVAPSGDRKTAGLSVSVRGLDLVEKLNANAISEGSAYNSSDANPEGEGGRQRTWRAERQAALNADPPRDLPP